MDAVKSDRWKRHTKWHFTIDITRQLNSCEIDRYCCIHMEIVTPKIAQEKHTANLTWQNEVERIERLLASGAQMTIDIIMSHLCNEYMIVSKFRLLLLLVLFYSQRNRCHVEYISIENVKDVSDCSMWITKLKTESMQTELRQKWCSQNANRNY